MLVREEPKTRFILHGTHDKATKPSGSQLFYDRAGHDWDATITKVIENLRERYKHIAVQDKGKRFNTDLLEAVELGFLLDLAEVVVYSALSRKESRGGHFRDDFPEKDPACAKFNVVSFKEVIEAAVGVGAHQGVDQGLPLVTVAHHRVGEQRFDQPEHGVARVGAA